MPVPGFIESPPGSGLYVPAEPVYNAQGTWNTLESARAAWVTPLTDERLTTLLMVAHEQCIAFLGGESLTPAQSQVEAEVMQARNIYNASKADPGQVSDDGTFIIRPYPMDNFVKQLLMPKRALGVFF